VLLIEFQRFRDVIILTGNDVTTIFFVTMCFVSHGHRLGCHKRAENEAILARDSNFRQLSLWCKVKLRTDSMVYYYRLTALART
jgi:hypothetical protein